MKKLIFIFALIMSILLEANAGWRVRGIDATNINFDNLMNYTLTFDGNGTSIAAATMNDVTLSLGFERNCIVIIYENSTTARVFPIQPGYDIQVRDFQIVTDDMYVMCGSRKTDVDVRSFIAVVTNNFNDMQFFEYQEADMFYSIWANNSGMDFYVCGTKGNLAVIASVDRGSLQLTNLFFTKEPWQYHKIIAIQNDVSKPTFVVSGRNPECTEIGFTTFDAGFNPANIDSYKWEQQTEPASLCVVSEDLLMLNSVIVASSYDKRVTFNPVTYPVVTPISAYRFFTHHIRSIKLYVQDIETIMESGEMRISVAGYATHVATQNSAWHGSMIGLSTAISMVNNHFFRTNDDRFENYKIRHHQQGVDFTGGYFQHNDEMCALFTKPLNPSICDYHYSAPPDLDFLDWTSFSLVPDYKEKPQELYSNSSFEDMHAFDECTPFKGGSAPEFAITPQEKESEITNFYDRITLKDTPSGTNYQIYSVTGQLILSGTTNPDISTVQLSRGMYILRLETGKAYKFVK